MITVIEFFFFDYAGEYMNVCMSAYDDNELDEL